jgi:hypothetical protein
VAIRWQSVKTPPGNRFPASWENVNLSFYFNRMAEGMGFEPTIRLLTV